MLANLATSNNAYMTKVKKADAIVSLVSENPQIRKPSTSKTYYKELSLHRSYTCRNRT